MSYTRLIASPVVQSEREGGGGGVQVEGTGICILPRGGRRSWLCRRIPCLDSLPVKAKFYIHTIG